MPANELALVVAVGGIALLIFWLWWKFIMIPYRMALRRNHPDSGTIWWVCFMTLVFLPAWFAALYWALQASPVVAADTNHHAMPPEAPNLPAGGDLPSASTNGTPVRPRRSWTP